MGAFLTGLASSDLGSSIMKKFKGRKKKTNNSGLDTDPNTGQLISSYKRGGKVRRTGLARLHKNERVLTAKQAKRYKSRGGRKRR